MNSSSTRGTMRMRTVIADLIADNFKAYDIPAVGERLGLAPGTEGEAFSSKRQYLSKRLNALSEHDLKEAARELAKDIDHPELNDFIANESPADGWISATLDRFDKDVVHRRWNAAIERRSNDPEGAITLARTLLEDVCKWLLTKQQIAYSDKTDLPALYRAVAGSLRLAPDAHTEEVFKRILGSCQSVVESLGTLRNKLSDSHSSGPLKAKPHSRHAELAVNLAGTMATFLIATWEAKLTGLK